MFNIVPHTLWVLCVHQHKVTSDWNVKLSLGITVLAASENLISSCFWLSHSHFPHSHSCANKDIGNTGLGRDFFFFNTETKTWWCWALVATAPDRKILRKESWFQGVSSCLKSWGEGQATAKGAYEVPHAWTMKQRMEWQEPGPSVTFRGQPSVAYFCHASPTSWRLHSLPQGQHPMRAKHSKH